MIAGGQTGSAFTSASIIANAPAKSGVYALYKANAGVGENRDILGYNPTHFLFEEWPEHQRVARQDQLIAQFRPLANKT